MNDLSVLGDTLLFLGPFLVLLLMLRQGIRHRREEARFRLRTAILLVLEERGTIVAPTLVDAFGEARSCDACTEMIAHTFAELHREGYVALRDCFEMEVCSLTLRGQHLLADPERTITPSFAPRQCVSFDHAVVHEVCR